jgi:hypothetical protein
MSLVAEASVRSFGEGVEKQMAFVLQTVSLHSTKTTSKQLTFVVPEAPM